MIWRGKYHSFVGVSQQYNLKQVSLRNPFRILMFFGENMALPTAEDIKVVCYARNGVKMASDVCFEASFSR